MALIGLVLVAVMLLVACNRDGEDSPETTVAPAASAATTTKAVADAGDSDGGTTLASDSAEPDPEAESESDAGETVTVAPTEVVSGMPSYEVVHRLIEDDRETLIVVVEPGTYSNVQLENLVFDIVERFTPSAVIVVDDQEVADLAVLEERTDEEQARLDAHTFLRIEKGVEVTFYGPYADFPGLTVGS